MFGFNKKPEKYTKEAYKRRKEEIINELASWCYTFDFSRIKEEYLEQRILSQTDDALRKLMEERVKFLQSDFYPIKISLKDYQKSDDSTFAIKGMKNAIWEVVEMCLTVPRLTMNRVEKAILSLEM